MSETSVSIDSIPNSVEEVPVVAGALSVGDVQSGIASIVKLGEVIVQLSGNQVVAKVVAAFTWLSSQDWFLKLIVGASSMFDKGQNNGQVFVSSCTPPENVIAACEGPIVAGAINPDDVLKSIESILQVATLVGTISKNDSILKAVTVLSSVVKESWFISIVVNAGRLFGL